MTVNCTKIVRQVIEEEIREFGSVSKYYVIEEIKNRIRPSVIFNKILTYSQDRSDAASDDGIRNLKIGAQKIFRDSWRTLRSRFEISEDGIITLRQESDSLITYNGKSKTVQEWSEELNIPIATLYYRFRNNWSVEKALTKESSKTNKSIGDVLLEVTPKEWTDRSKIRQDFFQMLSDTQAIAACVSRVKWEDKDKDNNRLSSLSDEEKIKKGRSLCFNRAIVNMSKCGYIDRLGEGKKSKFRLIKDRKKK